MTDRACPLPRPRSPPFADGEDHRPPRGAECHGPLRVEGTRTHAVRVAPVHLHVVDAPFGKAPRVAELIAETRWQVLTGLRARVGVDAETQPERVDAIGQSLDPAREL